MQHQDWYELMADIPGVTKDAIKLQVRPLLKCKSKYL